MFSFNTTLWSRDREERLKRQNQRSADGMNPSGVSSHSGSRINRLILFLVIAFIVGAIVAIIVTIYNLCDDW